MDDHIVTAEYTNADHSELEWVAKDNSRHKIRKDESPAFWHVVHQRTVLRDFSGAASTSRMIDITPRSPRLPSSSPVLPASSAQEADIQRLRARVSELEALLMEFAEIEVAAEAAILAMQPEGAVDPANRAWAVEALSEEAQLRGMALDALCPALVEARRERNKSIMAGRLARLKAGN